MDERQEKEKERASKLKHEERDHDISGVWECVLKSTSSRKEVSIVIV